MDLTEEALAYHGQLTTKAIEYLTGRGLEKRTIDHFKLGWIEEPLTPEARRFKDKPTIPYLTTTGRCIWLRARVGGSGAKYMPVRSDYPLKQPGVHLFNAQQAMPTTRRSTVYLVEGEYDTCIAWQAGVKAVGLPGTRSWQPAWRWLFAAADVKIAFDGDKPGQEAAEDLYATLIKARVNAELVALPDGKDLTDLWLEGGRQRVREALHA